MQKTAFSGWRASLRAMVFVAAAVALSGCVIEPLYGPRYHHSHYHDYGGY